MNVNGGCGRRRKRGRLGGAGSRRLPVISVDTNKKAVLLEKEGLGNFANKGKEWRPKNSPRKVKSHDFQ